MSPLSRRGGRFPGLLLAFMLILCSGLPLARLDAAAEERRSFALAGGRAEETLETFSDQAGAQIVYLLEDDRGVVTAAVRGELAIREALERLVVGTGLVVMQEGKSGAFFVKRGSLPSSASQIKHPSGPHSNTMKKTLLARLGSALGVVAASAFSAEPGFRPRPR